MLGRDANLLVKKNWFAWLAPNPRNTNPKNESMTTYDLKKIAEAGACLVVDAEDYSAYDLKTAAAALVGTATISIKGAQRFSAYDCKTIASVAPGRVLFDFTKRG